MTSTFGAKSTTDEVLGGVNLTGKRVLVTGVSAGLGVETARVLAAHGATVVGAARDLDKAHKATAQVRADAKDGGEGLSVRAIQTAGVDAGHPRDNVRAAIKLGIGRELVETAEGKRGAKLHRIANALPDMRRRDSRRAARSSRRSRAI